MIAKIAIESSRITLTFETDLDLDDVTNDVSWQPQH